MKEKREMEDWILGMAKEETWRVPRSCEEKVERILEGLPDTRGKEKRMVCFSKKRIWMLAIGFAALLGMTVAAAEVFQWREQAVKNFGNPTEEEQQTMATEGMARAQVATATDAGITITAQQTVQDKNTLYILLDVQADEAIIDGNGGFDYVDADGNYGESWILTEEEDAFHNISMGFSPDMPAFEELGRQGFYEISALKSMEREWKEESVTVRFTEYSYYTYENGETVPHKIEGDWSLTLPLGEETQLKTYVYEPEESVEIAGIPVKVKRMELSPLSLLLVFDMDDLLKLQEKLYAGEEDVYLYETAFAGFLNQEGQEILPGVGGQSGSYDYEKREVTYQIGLGKYIEPEQMTAVLLGDEKIAVPLK